MKVGVIGAGAWGTALAIVSAQGGADVVLWSYDGLHKDFDGVVMPKNIRMTANMADMHDMDTWLVVTPGAFFRETMRKARNEYTGQFMSEILATEIPECVDFGVLSGPQFAAEVAQGVPTGSTLAGTDKAIIAGQGALNKLYLETSSDIIGTQVCGVGKNAVALICGYNSVKCAENERALIFTRTWNEVMAIGIAMGGQMRSFLGLCGIGDLFLSATSATSRNFAGGMAIANGNPPQGTVEGIFALGGLIARAKDLGIDVPVLTEMQKKLNI